MTTVLISMSARRPTDRSVEKAKKVLKAADRAAEAEKKAKIKEMIAQAKIIYAERDAKLKDLDKDISANRKELEKAKREIKKMQNRASDLELKRNSIFDQYERKARKYWDQIAKIEAPQESITVAMTKRGKEQQKEVSSIAFGEYADRKGRKASPARKARQTDSDETAADQRRSARQGGNSRRGIKLN